MSTLAALQARAATRFQDAAYGIVTAQEWDDYINARYAQVWAASSSWPFKRSHATVSVTVNTRASSALSNGVWRVEAVLDTTNDTALFAIDGRTEPNKLDPGDTAQGQPQWYRLFGNTIEVWPLPDATVSLKVDVLLEYTALTCSVAPVFPAHYHDMLVEGALADAYADDGQPEAYARHEAKFQEYLIRLQTDLLDQQDEGYALITDNWWG